MPRPPVLPACLLCLLIGLVPAARAAEPAAPAAETAAEEAPQEDLTTRTTSALETLAEIRTALEPLGAVDDEREAIAEIEAAVAEVIPADFDAADENIDYVVLDTIVSEGRGLVDRLQRTGDALADESGKLEAQLAAINELDAAWSADDGVPADLPPALKTRIDGILEDAGELREAASAKLNAVVGLQNRVQEQRDRLDAIEREVRTADQDLQRRVLVANAPPLWVLTAEAIGVSSTRVPQTLLEQAERDVEAVIARHAAFVSLHLFSLPLLILMTLRLRRTRHEESSALNRPVAMGILLWWLLGAYLLLDAPVMVRILLSIGLAVSAVVVLLSFLPQRLRPGVLILVSLYVLERLGYVIPAADTASRLAYLLIGAGVAGIAATAIRARVVEDLRGLMVWPGVLKLILVAALALSLFGVLLNVIGYVQFGKLLVSGVIRSMALFLILFVSIRTIREVLGLALDLPALARARSISRNRRRLERWFQQPLVVLAFVLWVLGTLIIFGISEQVLDGLGAALSAELSIGEVILSMQGILTFVLALWLAIVTSRIVRSVLDEDVLPRMNLPRGIPHTISTTVHYVIVLIGLLLGSAFLGINLSSLAFILGAVGVGIGFGLQNLVNNFVSGLILIFERPIQVGDTVEVGTLLGRVTHIGIRTSRVRTYGGSEVIVPNGDLASNQVINWTLSDRRRRLEFEVGVAYGTDPEKVTALLHEVAEQDPVLLKDPAPDVVFEEFGDSSLNFRLYVWLPEFDIGFSSRHRVMMAIHAALRREGIEIPFPQRDLHLRSAPSASRSAPDVEALLKPGPS